MKRNIFFVLGVVIFLLGLSTLSEAQEKAAAQEVIQKVQEAAKSLSQSGEAGLAQFDKRDGPWGSKDTYVFVFDCAKGTIAAHPFRADLVGKDDTELRGTKGTEFSALRSNKNPRRRMGRVLVAKTGRKRGLAQN